MSPYERELRILAEPIKDIVEFQSSISRDRLLGEYQRAAIFCAPQLGRSIPIDRSGGDGVRRAGGFVARGGIPEGGAEQILYFSPPNVEELAERLAFFLKDAQTRTQWGSGRTREPRCLTGRTNIIS